MKKGNISAKDINRVLTFCKVKITDQMLKNMLAIDRLVFNDLSKDTIKSQEYIQNIGTYRGKIQIPGVYIWTHLSTGDMYVGSSSKLAKRLQGYFYGTHKSVGKFIPFLQLEGLSKFKLEIIPLKENYFANQELALEQYYLLHPEYNLNTLRIVNDFSGARSKALYMYNEDCTKLIYKSDIWEDFIFKLGIHHSTLTKCIKYGELYLGKYIFSENPILSAIESELSVADIFNILEIYRSEMQKTKGRKIVIKSISDKDDIKTFDTITECVSYLNTIAYSSKTTLYRHIESGKSYQGYICEYISGKVSALADKSVQISITHVPTNSINIYTSFRKAALSFAPEIQTTGQTLATYADSGKLFKDGYKIERINSK
jgi:hypothetical protein